MRFLSHWSGAMSKGHLDKDVVRQLFFFLVVSLLWLYQLTEVFQFHGLLPYGYPVRGLLDGERSNRYTVVGYNIQFSRRCPRQDYKDIHFKQLLLVVLVPVSFSVKSDPFGWFQGSGHLWDVSHCCSYLGHWSNSGKCTSNISLLPTNRAGRTSMIFLSRSLSR